jgi:hypothetical protein
MYAISPEMSHVSKAFAATDPDYWFHRPADTKPEVKPDPKSSTNHTK